MIVRAVRRRNSHWSHIKVTRVIKNHLVLEVLHSELCVHFHVLKTSSELISPIVEVVSTPVAFLPEKMLTVYATPVAFSENFMS